MVLWCILTILFSRQKDYGRVAQLDRVLASEAKGRGFKSRLVHQPLQQGCRLHDLDYSQEPLL